VRIIRAVVAAVTSPCCAIESSFLRVRGQGVVRVGEWEKRRWRRNRVWLSLSVVLARRAVFGCPHRVDACRAQSSARHASTVISNSSSGTARTNKETAKYCSFLNGTGAIHSVRAAPDFNLL
jgi:hypothetical protein